MRYLYLMICIGFFITVLNNSDKTLNVFTYWVDHPYQFNQPAMIFGGELDAGESFNVSSERVPGQYLSHWVDRHSDWDNVQLFKVNDKVRRVTITPSGVNQK